MGIEDPADRQVFTMSAEAWEELQEALDRPATAKPKIAALLAEESVIDINEGDGPDPRENNPF